jgi:DNA-3-methyladenine glycosylase I
MGGMKTRCGWGEMNPLMRRYHDSEWGVPQHEDRVLFEFLILEGAQAGLSWNTILQRRENYRKAFDNFDPARIAAYGAQKAKRLLSDPGIIRNRLKIQATIGNAKAFLAVQKEFGSFDAYLWNFVKQVPLRGAWKDHKQVPAKTDISDQMSKDLKRRGFSFVGSTICYAYMQAIGMVNDHIVTCYRYRELATKARRHK